jgi:single-strand DNA-binding protein
VNVVTLIGNLASDVELRELSEEKKVANFLLAVNRRSAEGGADFVRVATWGKQAETCAKFLAKGRRVAVDGRLRSRSWEDRDGKRRHSVEVVANQVQFLSGPGDSSEAPFEAAAAPS